jgi:hypothetical protein
MLKVACGLYFAIGAKDGVKIAEKYTIDLSKVQRAFFKSDWDARAGLYFKGSTGSAIAVAHTVGMAPLTMDSDRSFGGAMISLLGFTLELLFDTKNTNAGAWSGIVRRPTELVLKAKQRRHSIILTWPPGTPEASVIMEKGMPAPPNASISAS